MVKKQLMTACGYAWKFRPNPDNPNKWWLCKWAEPTVKSLKANGKPSPEAQVVRVRIVLEKDYRDLTK